MIATDRPAQSSRFGWYDLRSAVRTAAAILSLTALVAGCSAPRGAALQSEILRGTDDPALGVQVVPVTRASLAEIDSWPVPNPELRYNWTSTGAAPTARIIRAGDQLSISVWDSQTDSLLTSVEQRVVVMNDVPVSASGEVFVPYVGELRVSGMSAEQARREIQTRLTPIVPDAQVQLSVVPGSGNTIDVVTGVANPGRIPLTEISPTILSVLAESGGIANTLRNPLVRLNRAGTAYAIPARELFANPAHDIQLRGGDRILVEEDRRNFIAFGASGTQQVVNFERENISALDALSSVGGLQATRANLEGVMVLRTYPASMVRETGPFPQQTEVIFTFDLSSADGLFAAERFQIQHGDVVLAAEASLPILTNALAVIRSGVQTTQVFSN